VLGGRNREEIDGLMKRKEERRGGCGSDVVVVVVVWACACVAFKFSDRVWNASHEKLAVVHKRKFLVRSPFAIVSYPRKQ